MNRNREEAVIALALDKSPDKRAAFLEAMCEGDPALRQQLEALLAAHDQGDNTALATAPVGKATVKLGLPDAEDESPGVFT